MSLLKKVQKRSVERKFGGTHPILRMGLDRNVIDAYFTGLVFAAVADDEAVDEAERAKLEKIGLALNLSLDDVRGVVDEMLARDGDAKVAVAEEAAGALRGTDAIQLFLCEWTQIWMVHEYQADELNEFRRQLCEWMECEYDEKLFRKFDNVVAKVAGCIDEVFVLLDILSDEYLSYLLCDVSIEVESLLSKERQRRKAVEEERLANQVKAAKAKAERLTVAKVEKYMQSGFPTSQTRVKVVTEDSLCKLATMLREEGFGEIDISRASMAVAQQYINYADEQFAVVESVVNGEMREELKMAGIDVFNFASGFFCNTTRKRTGELVGTFWRLVGLMVLKKNAGCF